MVQHFEESKAKILEQMIAKKNKGKKWNCHFTNLYFYTFTKILNFSP